MNPFNKLFKARAKPAQNTLPGSRFDFFFGGSTSGKNVNERTAMQTTAVYACVRILAETVASLPLHTFRHTEHGKTKAHAHALYRLLHSEPNPEMTSFVFRETLMSHLLLWGNAYAQIIRDGHGRVLALYPLLPDRMRVDRSDRGELVYCYHSDRGTHTLGRHEVLHIPGLGFDGLVGYSPIAMARNAIGMALATEEYGASFFANGASPGGVLEHPGTLKDPKKVRDSWNAVFEGSGNAHRIAVLEEGMKFQTIGIPPDQAQFLETRKFQTEEICRIFRVPPHLVASLDRATFCLPADTLVFTETGPKPINEIAEGEVVWSLGEDRMERARVVKSICSGTDEILKIKTTNRTLRANAGHRILVRRKYPEPKPGMGGYQHIRWANEYVPAGELRVGDTIVALEQLPDDGLDHCPTRTVSVGFMEFCGLLIGDGNVSKKRGVTIARHTNAGYMDHYREVIRKEFVSFGRNGNGRTRDLPTNPVNLLEYERMTRFGSVLAAEELEQLGFCGNAHTKQVPGWVFKLRRELKLAFLRGYLDADGHVDKKGRMAFASVNERMLSQVRHLCISVGVPVTNTTFSTVKARLPNGRIFHSGVYAFTCSDPGKNREIGSNDPRYRERLLNGRPFDRKGRAYPHYGGKGFDLPGCGLSRITSIEPQPAEPVYDLTVEGTHSFVADGVIVHNSNIEHQSISFVVHTIRPWLVRIEQSINKTLLLDTEKSQYFAGFVVEGLLRGDYASRMQGYATARQNGWMSANDIRALENLDRIPEDQGGDLYLINGNMTKLGDAGAFANKNTSRQEEKNEGGKTH